MTLWNREPALIITFIAAFIALGIGFGLPVTVDQLALIMAAVTALIGVLVRSQVVPTSKLVAFPQGNAQPVDGEPKV